MRISFKEKSEWFVLVSLVLVYGNYFAQVLPNRGPEVAATDMARFVGAIVTLVILQIVGQALLATANRREIARGVQHDERDTMIDLRASRVGSYALATGVLLALLTALQVPGNFAFVHVLFGSWVVSQALEIATRLLLYRRGV